MVSIWWLMCVCLYPYKFMILLVGWLKHIYPVMCNVLLILVKIDAAPFFIRRRSHQPRKWMHTPSFNWTWNLLICHPLIKASSNNSKLFSFISDKYGWLCTSIDINGTDVKVTEVVYIQTKWLACVLVLFYRFRSANTRCAAIHQFTKCESRMIAAWAIMRIFLNFKRG